MTDERHHLALLRYRSALSVAIVMVAGACTGGPSTLGRVAAAGAAPGGTLVVGITTPGSLDPSNAYEPAGDQVMSTICEPLATFDPLTASLRPGIAQSWIISNSGSLVSVRLRSGVRLQNGATVHANDVRDELSRVASLTNASYDAPLLQNVVGYDQIHGDVDTNNSLDLRQLKGIQTISNDSFSIAWTHPDADLITVLGDLIAAPVPAKLAAADPATLATNPVCAGPYRMAAPWRPGQSDIIVKRFSGYYAHNPSYPRGGVGYADTIDFRVFKTQADELTAFGAGQIDIAGITDVDVAKAPSDGQVVSAPNGYVEYLGLPNGTNGSIFAQSAVHVALSQAIDRQKLGQIAYGATTLPATGFFPPTVGDLYRTNACGASVPETADPTAARATLAKAGISLAGQTLKFYFNDQFQNRLLAEAIAAQWTENLGLKVTPVAAPWNQYVSTADGSGGFDGAFLESWRSPYPSADNYLYPLFDSASVGTNNFAHYIDADFDRSMQYVARQATGNASRSLAYQHLAGSLCQRLPLVPLVFRQSSYVVRTARLGSAIGSFTDASSGLLDLREIYNRP